MKPYGLKGLELLAGRPRPAACEVCGEAGVICWDHDHTSGRFRGWICKGCNSSLGFARDDPEVLERLSVYAQTGGTRRALRQRKETCVNGHEMRGENVYVRRNGGGRQCRACKRERMRRYNARGRDEQAA